MPAIGPGNNQVFVYGGTNEVWGVSSSVVEYRCLSMPRMSAKRAAGMFATRTLSGARPTERDDYPHHQQQCPAWATGRWDSRAMGVCLIVQMISSSSANRKQAKILTHLRARSVQAIRTSD